MGTILLVGMFFLTLWQLVKSICTYRQNQQLILAKQLQLYASQMGYFTIIEEKNQNLLDFCHGLGQSIAALHIQIQVAQKLWQVNPKQAEQSLSEAYQISGSLMYEVRQIVRVMGEDYLNNEQENPVSTKIESEKYVSF